MRFWRRHAGLSRAGLLLALAGLLLAAPAGAVCDACAFGDTPDDARGMRMHMSDHEGASGDHATTDGTPDRMDCCPSCPLGCAVAIALPAASGAAPFTAYVGSHRPNVHTPAEHTLATPPPRTYA